MASHGRTPEQIRADLAASRHAMTVGIEGIISEVHPTALKNRAVDEAKQTVNNAKEMFTDTASEAVHFFYDEGGIKWNNVGTVVLIGLGVAIALSGVSGGAALVRKVIR